MPTGKGCQNTLAAGPADSVRVPAACATPQLPQNLPEPEFWPQCRQMSIIAPHVVLFVSRSRRGPSTRRSAATGG